MRFLSSIFIVILLTTNTANSEQLNWTENLIAAILQEDTDKIKTLVSEKKELNQTSPDNQLPLIEAAIQSTPSILELLINLGFDINIKDENGYTPIMHALQFGSIENAKKLKSLEASLEGITNDGYTVRLLAENVGLEDFGPLYKSKNNYALTKDEANQILLYAAEMGDLESVNFALDNGAVANTKAKNGWTPIMLAALGGHIDIFDVLLTHSLVRNDLYYEAEGVDLVTAILVGNADGGDERKEIVEKMLKRIKALYSLNKGNSKNNKIENYHTIAKKLNYPQPILSFFPKKYKPQPKLENDIPIGIPSTKENWKLVQKVLKDAGVYEGAIDGQPGKGTLAALYAYHMPLAKVLKERSTIISKEAKEFKSNAFQNLAIGQIESGCSEGKYTDSGLPYRICGEYTKTKNSFNRSGYYRETANHDDYYTFYRGDSNDVDEYSIKVIVAYDIKKQKKDKAHTHIIAKILDKEYQISLRAKEAFHFLGDGPSDFVKGNFPPPKR